MGLGKHLFSSGACILPSARRLFCAALALSFLVHWDHCCQCMVSQIIVYHSLCCLLICLNLSVWPPLVPCMNLGEIEYNPWFPFFRMHQNHHEGLYEYRWPDRISQALIQVLVHGLRLCISTKFRSDAVAVGLDITHWESLLQSCPTKSSHQIPGYLLSPQLAGCTPTSFPTLPILSPLHSDLFLSVKASQISWRFCWLSEPCTVNEWWADESPEHRLGSSRCTQSPSLPSFSLGHHDLHLHTFFSPLLPYVEDHELSLPLSLQSVNSPLGSHASPDKDRSSPGELLTPRKSSQWCLWNISVEPKDFLQASNYCH